MNQASYFGYNSIRKIHTISKKMKIKKIFLVNDKASYSLCGAESFFNSLKQRCAIYVFNDFELNPRLEDVGRGIKEFKKQDFDAIVAVGGGTAIDMAKLINILSIQPGNPADYIKKKRTIEKKGIPSIAIPTTAGTGSEATHFAVVYINKVKYSLAHKYILPDYAIIDPQFTLSMPSIFTATTGMDALAQGIESFWSINSTQESMKYSEKAIRLAVFHLRGAVHKPDKRNRKNMALAANYAGRAINITRTSAPHAFSYFFTSYYNIPHGHAVGLLLGKFIEYNCRTNDTDVNDKRGTAYVKKIMNRLSAMLPNSIEQLMKDIGLETDLRVIGIRTEEDVNRLLEHVNLERLVNNPRKVDPEEVRKMLLLPDSV